MHKNRDNFEKRIWLFLPAMPAPFLGLIADRLFFRWEEPYCMALCLILTAYVIPAIAWVRDLIPEWHFRIAIRKELDQAFQILEVGKGLAKRQTVTVKEL